MSEVGEMPEPSVQAPVAAVGGIDAIQPEAKYGGQDGPVTPDLPAAIRSAVAAP